MKQYFKNSLLILTITTSLVSCSHQPMHEQPDGQKRAVAAQSCWDSVKGEYNSYFDSVEKCIEKESDK